MCACTEPVRTGIGVVCVEYGRPKWPIMMLNHTPHTPHITHTTHTTHTHNAQHKTHTTHNTPTHTPTQAPTPTHTHIVQKNVLFLFLAPYARTTRYEGGFFFLGKPRKRRLASLARLMIPFNFCLYFIA